MNPDIPSAIAPAYVAFYPSLADVAREHGYALAIHGSVSNRDLDLVAIPWVEDAASTEILVFAIRQYAGSVMARMFGEESVVSGPEEKPHGRKAWCICIGNGAVIDLSVMPRPTEALERIESLQRLVGVRVDEDES